MTRGSAIFQGPIRDEEVAVSHPAIYRHTEYRASGTHDTGHALPQGCTVRPLPVRCRAGPRPLGHGCRHQPDGRHQHMERTFWTSGKPASGYTRPAPSSAPAPASPRWPGTCLPAAGRALIGNRYDLATHQGQH
ncbi:hypothetical protein GCM10010211_71090 [Streptomyces albospinus]|uniref:Uncharacterized protein n=1 Tax=Streptomyces albospinus TaxID=285515 RepID=A0ABQ2VLD9_9ACTN|nr:hypothetical protein GCM10010211_71090 [Streptomyces albospinus]